MQTDFTIRMALPTDDADRAALLAPTYHCAPETLIAEAAEIRRRFRSFGDLAPGLVAWVAADRDGAVIAAAEATVRLHANGCETLRILFLEGLAIAAAHRGRGVGAAILGTAESWARQQGISEIASDIQADDAAARHWHRRMGFEETETVICLRRRIG